jgi:hypothetical protein
MLQYIYYDTSKLAFFKNISSYNKSYITSKFTTLPQTHGSIYGETPNLQQQGSTNTFTNTFNHQNHSYGYGTQSAQIWLWDSKCSNKIRVFAWLLMMDRLNMWKRKKYKLERNDYSCPMCLEHREETTFHLFFSYPFSTECWRC